jgi:multidrug efflux pump subunit AcrA (membrane-fusion protein)
MAVAENQRAHVGDLIARLESERLARARAAEPSTPMPRELKRAENMRGGGAASRHADRADPPRRLGSAARPARVALDNREIRAPIDGTGIRRIRDVGEFLTTASPPRATRHRRRHARRPLRARGVTDVGERPQGHARHGGAQTPEAMPRQRGPPT